MKKTLFMILAVLLTAACQQERTFTVEGTISGAGDSTLYLYNRSLTGIVLIDSVKLPADGKFSFSPLAPVGGPDLYVLRVGNQWLNLAVDSTETITITASLDDLSQGYSVSGSESSEMVRRLSVMHSRLQQQVFAVEQNTTLIGQPMLDSLRTLIAAYKDSVAKGYIYDAPQTSYAYFALSQTLNHLYWRTSPIFEMGDSVDDRAYRAVATCWKQYYPESERAQQLYNMVERDITNSRIAAARRQQSIDEDKIVFSDLIDLSLPDPNGRMRTLSELKGMVVILDFHLFSTPESGARILKLRELYNRYHDRGLEIYQVSADQDEHLWRQAVSSLPWVSVYDPSLSSCNSYNVQELPEFFLIDRQNALQFRSSMITNLEAEIERML